MSLLRLCVIDFRAELPDIVDEENFSVIPFIEIAEERRIKMNESITITAPAASFRRSVPASSGAGARPAAA